MSATATAVTVDATLNHFIVTGTIAVSGSYPGTPGDTLSFEGISGPPLPAGAAPDFVTITEQPPSGTAASGVVYRFAKGTTQANGQLQCYVTGTAAGDVLNQVGNVTYASLNIANLHFQAWFNKFQ